MDPNVRLSKLDCPEVVDPLLHRKYRSIVGCLSYLVNMTRPDLAFSFFQHSKFLQYPGEARLAAAYRVLAYVKGTLYQGLSWHDPGAGSRNKLSGWVDSDFSIDYWAVYKNFASQSQRKYKIIIFFPGEAKDRVIFPFYFLLHKRAKPAP